MLDRNFTVKISDFGLSRIKEDSSEATQNIGSPLWMAPEVLSGSYDNRCDIYSYSIIMYEVMTGKKPYYDVKVNFNSRAGDGRGRGEEKKRNNDPTRTYHRKNSKFIIWLPNPKIFDPTSRKSFIPKTKRSELAKKNTSSS